MRRLALLVALALATASCRNEIDESTRPQNVEGTYTLVSYGGALPATYISDASGTSQVIAGELVMTPDRHWTQTFTVAVSSSSGAQTFLTTSEGTWVLIRDQGYVSFYDTINKYSFSGIAAGGQVTLTTQGGREVVFKH